jgi:hypothetical protein
MQNADDFNDILADAVDGQKGKTRKYQFAGVRLAARTALVGKPREQAHFFIDVEGYAPSRCRGIVVPDVVTDMSEIARWQDLSSECALTGVAAVDELADFLVFDKFAPVSGG